MAAGLNSLAAITAVVAGNHVPRIAMKYILFMTLSRLTMQSCKYVDTNCDHSSLVWYDYIVGSRDKYSGKCESCVACRSTGWKRNAGEAFFLSPAGDGGIAAMSWGTGLGDVRRRQACEPAAPAPSRPSDVGSVTSAGLGLHTLVSPGEDAVAWAVGSQGEGRSRKRLIAGHSGGIKICACK